MNVVIDIPEWLYKSVCENTLYEEPELYQAVAQGHVLKKGYLDASKIEAFHSFEYDGKTIDSLDDYYRISTIDRDGRGNFND